MWNRMRKMTMDTRGLNGVRLAAVGSATARALEGKGLLADDVPKECSAARLGEGLAKRVEQGGLVLLARAKIRDHLQRLDSLTFSRWFHSFRFCSCRRTSIFLLGLGCMDWTGYGTKHNITPKKVTAGA